MFDKFFKAVKAFFNKETVRVQFEEMILQEAVAEAKAAKQVIPPVVADYVPSHGAHADPKLITAMPVHGAHAHVETVNDQITDAVTAPAKPKRAKTAKGKFRADDKVTLEVNEAWEGGVAPPKKTRKKKVD